MLFSNSHEENEEKKFTKGQNKFVTPFLNKNDSNAYSLLNQFLKLFRTSKPVGKKGSGASNNAEEVDERLKNIEPRM